MRCGRCGNENSEGNRFCGMCGASLVPKTETANRPTAGGADSRPEVVAARGSGEARLPTRFANDVNSGAAAPTATRPPTANATVPRQSPRPPAPPTPAPSISSPPSNGSPVNGDPVISGPSFLGLNKPADGRSSQGRADWRRGPDSHTSGNLDYLLDDDEEEPKRGAGKLLLVLVALALIGGFGYLRWKQGGFDFLKPARTAATAPSAPDSESAPPASTPTPEAATANPTVPNSAPTATTPNAPQPSATTDSATPDVSANGTTPAPAAGIAASNRTGSGAPQPTTANPAHASSAPADNAVPAKPQDNPSSDKSTASDSTEDAEAAPAKPESHVQPAEPKPSAAQTLRARKPTPITPADPTAEAARYIYGDGVAQDCDRGLRLLKPAAAQANPKAMTLLGSLYSSGTCTPRDLPTAYRWFALSLHKEPDNQRLQDDLQKLWSQMTQPERQLAIKLSQ